LISFGVFDKVQCNETPWNTAIAHVSGVCFSFSFFISVIWGHFY